MKILFSAVSVVKIEIEQIDLLIKSAKRYFLCNHEIHYVIFTDIKDTPIIENVRFINIDNSFSKSISYYQFQKILSLNYINLDYYDYVFVHDIDQVYVDYVDDSDLLTNDLCVLSHLNGEKIKTGLKWWTNIIEIENDLEHTTGNFWGGPTHLIKLFLEYTNKFWNINKDIKNERVNFFSEHPEEVLLIKFIDYYRIKERRLSSSLNFDTPSFLTSITHNGDIKDYQLKNFKLIHDTKVNIEWSNILFSKSIYFYYI
jgi:hypothetical protein